RSPARLKRFRSASRPWRTSSFAAPAISSGRRIRRSRSARRDAGCGAVFLCRSERALAREESAPGANVPMMLALSILLGLLPLLGVAWTIRNGTITPVDGLFTSLILLPLSGILFLNAYLDVRKRLRDKSQPPEKAH